MKHSQETRPELFRRVIRDVVGKEAFNCEREETPLQFTCMSYVRTEQDWIDKMIRERHVRQPGIIYGFYESSVELQAFAIEKEGEAPGFIAISSYCLVSLGSFFKAALAHNNVLREFGDPSLELSAEALGPGPHLWIRSQDPERRLIVKLLTMMAMRFVTAHEMTHILNGHIRHRFAGQAHGQMAEASKTLSSEQALYSQTLEMDADCGAMVDCMPGVILAERDLAEIIRIGCHPVFQKPELALRLWAFAVYSVFRVMEDAALEGSSMEVASHPPPMLRIQMVMGALYEFLKREKLDRLIALIPQIITQSIDDGEAAYASILNRPADLGPLGRSVGPESQKRISEIIRAWRDVRPIIEPFARGGGKLAPLPEDT